MTETLDTVDNSLQEVEEQLLAEFARIRNTLSDAQFEAIDPGIKTALAGVVDELHAILEATGDASNLQLMTRQHEVLLARIAVLRQLLNTKVPTAFLHEAHTEVANSRRQYARTEQAKARIHNHPSEQNDSSTGIFGKLKGMFGSEQDNLRDIAEGPGSNDRTEPVSIYLDNGIYSASRELATLVNVFSLPQAAQQELRELHEAKMREAIKGKASFGARDLASRSSESMPEVITKPRSSIAQSPEEIRRKLAERNLTDQASDIKKASFSAKDIDHVEAVNVPQRPIPDPELTATEIAAKRRAELEAEKAKQPTTGKASFLSKDIEPVVPQEVPQRRPVADTSQPLVPQDTKPEPPRTGKASFTAVDIEPVVPQEPPRRREKPKEDSESDDSEQEETPRSGKAVFESRDLSTPPPTNKR